MPDTGIAPKGTPTSNYVLAPLPVPSVAMDGTASRSMELRPGDLIMTATPEGVGPVGRGQVMTGGIDGLGGIKVAVR